MRIETNHRLVQRNRRIAQYLFFFQPRRAHRRLPLR